ncbi:hypothetical protein D3C76_1580260 [compost metagenome]
MVVQLTGCRHRILSNLDELCDGFLYGAACCIFHLQGSSCDDAEAFASDLSVACHLCKCIRCCASCAHGSADLSRKVSHRPDIAACSVSAKQ